MTAGKPAPHLTVCSLSLSLSLSLLKSKGSHHANLSGEHTHALQQHVAIANTNTHTHTHKSPSSFTAVPLPRATCHLLREERAGSLCLRMWELVLILCRERRSDGRAPVTVWDQRSLASDLFTLWSRSEASRYECACKHDAYRVQLSYSIFQRTSAFISLWSHSCFIPQHIRLKRPAYIFQFQFLESKHVCVLDLKALTEGEIIKERFTLWPVG